MKHLAAVVFFLWFLSPAASAQDKPNFTGTWILDVAKSSITPSPELPIEPETLIVTQSEKELQFERRVAGETTKQTVLFDYPTAEFNGRSGAFEGISASWKHGALVLTGAAETPESQRARRANKEKPPPIPNLTPSFTPQLKPVSVLTWALSDGGQTLTVQGLAVRVWTEPTGDKVSEEVRAMWVYRKQ